MKPDRIEALIKDIAATHGIAVGRDDPIMVLHTVNEQLMRDSATAQQEALDRFEQALEAIAHRWGEDARGKAERTLNAALAASRDAMMRSMQEGAKAAATAARHEIDAALATTPRDRRRARDHAPRGPPHRDHEPRRGQHGCLRGGPRPAVDAVRPASGTRDDGDERI